MACFLWVGVCPGVGGSVHVFVACGLCWCLFCPGRGRDGYGKPPVVGVGAMVGGVPRPGPTKNAPQHEWLASCRGRPGPGV